MNNIFFTGASGYSGSKISKYLLSKKCKVFSIYKKTKIKKKNSIKINLLNTIKVKQNFHTVIHAASHHRINDFKRKPQLKKKNNIDMTKNLINFCLKKKN